MDHTVVITVPVIWVLLFARTWPVITASSAPIDGILWKC